MSPISRFLFWSVSLAVASELAYRAWKRWRDIPHITRKRRISKHEVVMFRPHDGDGDNLTRSKYSRCRLSPQLDRVIVNLCSARHSLDVAIYVFTNVDLSKALRKLLRSGVVVRLIVDADMVYASGSEVRRLESVGAMVRCRRSSNLMHHKFCLVDANTDIADVTPVLMTGSLNWTNQALSGNWENVLFTSQPILVEQYKREFERLWVELRNNSLDPPNV